MGNPKLSARMPAVTPVFCVCIGLAAGLMCLANDLPDTQAVQGKWAPAKAELAGQPMAEAVLKTISLNLDQSRYEVFVGRQADRGTYTLDPASKPKRMTILGTDGPNRGKTILAIYQLQGDTLRVCYDLSGKQHPNEFKSLAGTQIYLVTYTRQ